MASIPLAFSIHNFISSVGADAGFAAIIGLAILVLLYFAHARETANLREEAALLTQRLMQAEARVAQLTRAQAASAPAQTIFPAPQAQQDAALAAQAARPAATPPASPLLPFAPAGVGAPALAAATRVVPLARAEAAQAPVAATAAAAARQAPEPEPVRQEPPLAGPPPTPPAPFGDERAAAAPVAAPPAATVAGANGAGNGQGVPPTPGASLPPLPTRPRPGGPAAPGPLPPLGEPPRRRSRLGRAIAALVGVGLVAAVVAVLLIATSGGSTNSSSTPAARTTNTPRTTSKTRAAAPFLPSKVTVAVLNGTNVNQLAHRVAAKLTAGGYKQGNLYTATNQTEQTTVVSYFPGAANRTAALHVATALNLKPSAVQPIDQTTQQVACPGSAGTAPCANVVVTVGADLSTL